eukprot:895560_1
MAAMYKNHLYSDVIELMFYIHTPPMNAKVIMDTDNKPRATLLCAVYQAASDHGGAKDLELFLKMIDEHGIDMYDNVHKGCQTALHTVCREGKAISKDQSVAVTKALLQKATKRYLKALDHEGKSLFMQLEVDAVLMDLIWDRFNELCEKEEEEEKEDRMSINDEKTEYLNAVVPHGFPHAGYHAMQLMIEYGKEECLRKFLSFYPRDSKRDILLKTDLPDHASFLICCAVKNDIGFCDILWGAIEEVCNGDEHRDEIITNYLNVQNKDGYTALMVLENG